MQEPLVSVIVPVYKAEPFLRKCLDSIVTQTYRRLQIILVDDGSPDSCGTICDEYARRDDRITMLHQENGGLSEARNVGLDRADGEWIAFIDSDDWVEPDFVLRMLSGALESGADIVACGGYEESNGKSTRYGPRNRRLLHRDDALRSLLTEDEIANHACDKLWQAALFGTEYRFPVGQAFEDVALSYQLFGRAEGVLFLPDGLYHYRFHSGGIMGSGDLTNMLDHYLAAKDRYVCLEKEYPQFQTLLEGSCVRAAIGAWCCYYRNDKEARRENKALMAEISAFAGQHPPEESIVNSVGLAGRIVLRLIPYNRWWSFAAARAISGLYQIRHGRAL